MISIIPSHRCHTYQFFSGEQTTLKLFNYIQCVFLDISNIIFSILISPDSAYHWLSHHLAITKTLSPCSQNSSIANLNKYKFFVLLFLTLKIITNYCSKWHLMSRVFYFFAYIVHFLGVNNWLFTIYLLFLKSLV